ncbi:MAG: DUF302 domain-containing protein [Candidatus Fermentibacteraceae bacterium]|nr:DUF302 domain-containing protein [Candidatus Fermentibacteraceae bacterium]
MKTKLILTGIAGFILGVLLTGIIGITAAPGMMMNENESNYSFDETVEMIQAEAIEAGWKVPAVHNIRNSVANGGFDVAPVTVIELCKVDLAGQILSEDESRIVSSMMPCRVAVYEDEEGRVIVSRMNTGLVSKLFGGNVETIMADATAETEQIVGSVLN